MIPKRTQCVAARMRAHWPSVITPKRRDARILATPTDGQADSMIVLASRMIARRQRVPSDRRARTESYCEQTAGLSKSRLNGRVSSWTACIHPLHASRSRAADSQNRLRELCSNSHQVLPCMMRLAKLPCRRTSPLIVVKSCYRATQAHWCTKAMNVSNREISVRHQDITHQAWTALQTLAVFSVFERRHG